MSGDDEFERGIVGDARGIFVLFFFGFPTSNLIIQSGHERNGEFLSTCFLFCFCCSSCHHRSRRRTKAVGGVYYRWTAHLSRRHDESARNWREKDPKEFDTSSQTIHGCVALFFWTLFLCVHVSCWTIDIVARWKKKELEFISINNVLTRRTSVSHTQDEAVGAPVVRPQFYC